MWDEYAASIGTTANKLTQEQKIQAEVNGILNETRFQTGDAAKVAGTYSGQVASLGYNFQNLKVAVGNALIPIAQAVLPGINAIIAGLTKLANVFAKVTALLFGKSVSTTSPQVKVQNEIASSGIAAADATDKLADSTSGAGKAAKQAAKDMKGVLASFDELNILQNQAESGSSGSGGAAGGVGGGEIAIPEIAPNGELFGDVTVNDEIEKAIRRIIAELNRLKKILKSGFDFGFGNTNFNPILESIANIGKHLTDIFTDSNVQEAAGRFVDSFVFTIGTLAGSLVSVGATITQALLGGVEQYLNDNSDRIKEWIIRIFDVGTEINEIISNFSSTFADIFSVFGGESAQSIAESIISIFSDIFGGTIEVALKFARDLLDTITGPFIENKDLIKTTLEGFLEPVSQVMESIAGTVRTTVDGIVALYDEHIHPFIMSVKESFTEWFEHVLEGFNTYIKPVLDDFAEKFDEVVNQHVKPMIEKAIEFFGKLFDAVKLVWDNVLSPLVTWVIDNAYPIIAEALDDIGYVFNTLLSVVSDVVGGIFEALGGVIDFITGVFTGDWDKAWDGVKSIFKGVWNGIVGILEGAINLVIRGINKMIGALNKISFSTPDWVPVIGGKSFGFNIKTIGEVTLPRLANGAVIPPNQQFAAILGDQRSGKNIEAPAGLIENIVTSAVSKAMATGGNNQPIQVNVMLDKKVLARAMVREVNDMTRAAGRSVLDF